MRASSAVSPVRAARGPASPLAAVRLRDAGGLSEFLHLLRRRRREEVHGPRDDAGPARLVAGAHALAVVAVEVLVEEHQVAPVRVLLELAGVPVDGPPAGGVLQEDARQPAR